MSKSRGLFITGTDTEVGKTYVTAMIARQLHEEGHSVGVYKPAASGCHKEFGTLISPDAVALWDAAGNHGQLQYVCPQLFRAPLAPHLAARAEGKELDEQLLIDGIDYWTNNSEIVLVEGAGGLMSPMGDDLYVADLADQFGFLLIVVTKNVLGTINQTIQTLITAATFRDGLDIAGIVLNQISPPQNDDPSAASNRRELANRCVPPLLAGVSWQATRFDGDVNWFELAGRR